MRYAGFWNKKEKTVTQKKLGDCVITMLERAYDEGLLRVDRNDLYEITRWISHKEETRVSLDIDDKFAIRVEKKDEDSLCLQMRIAN